MGRRHVQLTVLKLTFPDPGASMTVERRDMYARSSLAEDVRCAFLEEQDLDRVERVQGRIEHELLQ